MPRRLNGISAEFLREVLSYDPETGKFVWLRALSWRRGAGAEAGTSTKNGYLKIGIKGSEFLCHRLAWIHHYGKDPGGFIDHINGNKSDNRIANLRLASHSENRANVHKLRSDNTSGYRGVFRHAQMKDKWYAKIGIQQKQKYLGIFDNKEDAKACYDKALKKYFGEFANTSV